MERVESTVLQAYEQVVLVGRGGARLNALGERTAALPGITVSLVNSISSDAVGAQALVLYDVHGQDAPSLHVLLQSRTPAAFALFDLAPELLLEPLLNRRGLRGVFLAGAPLEQVLTGIAALLRGELWLPRTLMAELIELRRDEPALLPSEIWELTPRERRVVGLLMEGASNKEIARRLNLGVATVKSHLHKIYRKLGVGNRLQAARVARELRGGFSA